MDGKQLLTQFYQFFNQREFDSAMNLLSDSAEMVDVTTREKFVGKKEIRRYLEHWIQAFPDGKITNSRISGTADFAINEYIGSGTHTGPLLTPQGTIPATGRKGEVRFCEVWDVKNGKLEFGRSYYDGAAMMEQLGISALPVVKAQELKPVELRPH